MYQIPKASPATTPHDHSTMAEGSMPVQTRLQWTLPVSWQETAGGEMRLASFSVKSENGQTADVSIIALPGMAGGDLNNVNRWRGQVGLSPVAEEDLARLAESVDVGGSAGVLFDQAGTAASGDATRVLATILHTPDAAWFFKMTGDDELVVKQKPVFIEFLEIPEVRCQHRFKTRTAGGSSIDWRGDSHDDGNPSTGKPHWEVPANWTEEPATQMLLAKFSVNDGDTKADITVSSFPGDVGGLLANVNRWRRQANLPAIDDAQLPDAVKRISVRSEVGTLVELENPDGKSASLIGVAVPHNGQTWFFKMFGNPKLVAREKDSFLKFVQNVKLPDAP